MSHKIHLREDEGAIGVWALIVFGDISSWRDFKGCLPMKMCPHTPIFQVDVSPYLYLPI